jgi:hypothetical protein
MTNVVKHLDLGCYTTLRASLSYKYVKFLPNHTLHETICIKIRSPYNNYVVCRKEKIMKRIATAIIIAIVASTCIAHADPNLEKRVAELEKEVTELKAALAPVMAKAKAEQIVSQQRTKAKQRMRKDSEHYSRDDLRKIETLYQVANKQWQTQEGKDSLEILIEKYDNANRTGCALLYLGQMKKGKDREEYLKRAIDDFGDCFYGDGVQVGAYARYYLAYHYKEEGQSSKAKDLYEELADKYPDAIDHKGKLLADLIK